MSDRLKFVTMIDCPECKNEGGEIFKLWAFMKHLANGMLHITLVCGKFENAHKFENGANIETIVKNNFPEFMSVDGVI